MKKSKVGTITRDPYFDTLKGIAILLVVAGHCIQFGNGHEYFLNREYYENLVFRCIYSFHMPLFMLICGYFFYSSASKRTFIETLSNKCQTILIPIISFGIVTFLIWKSVNLDFVFFTAGLDDLLIECIRHIRLSLWFFWALFKLSIIVAAIQKYLRDNNYIHIFVLLLVLIFPIPQLTELEKSVYPFFLLGYWSKKYNWWNILQRKYTKYGLFLLGITYIICLYYFHKDTFVYTTGVTIWNSDLGYYQILIDLQRFFTGLFGSLLCLFLVKFICDKMRIDSIVRTLSFLGKFSGGIYCVHSSLLPVGIFVTVLPNNLIYGPVVFIPVLIYSILISWLLSKNKYTNYFFLGGR